MTTFKDNKGFWEYSIFQKIIVPNEEQNIKISLKPENSFNPNLIDQYINPQILKQEKIYNDVTESIEKGIAIKLNKSDKIIYDKYVNDIKNISVQKFVNVYDKKNRYDDRIEDKLFDMMITLIDRKVNKTPVDNKSEKFRRMPQDGGKVVLFGQRQNM